MLGSKYTALEPKKWAAAALAELSSKQTHLKKLSQKPQLIPNLTFWMKRPSEELKQQVNQQEVVESTQDSDKHKQKHNNDDESEWSDWKWRKKSQGEDEWTVTVNTCSNSGADCSILGESAKTSDNKAANKERTARDWSSPQHLTEDTETGGSHSPHGWQHCPPQGHVSAQWQSERPKKYWKKWILYQRSWFTDLLPRAAVVRGEEHSAHLGQKAATIMARLTAHQS